MSKSIESTFPEKQVSDEELKMWLNANLNILFCGDYGNGKTERIKKAMTDLYGDDWVYISGATVDPYIDVVGIPKAVVRNGEDILEFIRPKGMNKSMKAIFIDEYNRCPKLVASAMMELIQFKSINGVKFESLGSVCAAINPPPENDSEDENFYSVEPMDPAQLDRFQIRVRIPNGPCPKYFRQKWDTDGTVIYNWWKRQAIAHRKILSARRLEFILQAHRQGINIADLCPKDVRVEDLLETLSSDENEIAYFKFREMESEEAFTALIRNKEDWDIQKERLVGDGYWRFFHLIDHEVLCSEIEADPNFGAEAFVRASVTEKSLAEIFDGLAVSDLAKKWQKAKILLKSQSPSTLYDSDLILAGDTRSNAGLPESFTGGNFKQYIGSAGKNWGGVELNVRNDFFKNVLSAADDIPWGNEETVADILGFLQIQAKSYNSAAMDFYRLNFEKVLFTMFCYGLDKDDSRVQGIIGTIKGMLMQPDTFLNNVSLVVRPRVLNPIRDILAQ